MKIEYIREYLTLAEVLNFSATAERLHMSQPVLSAHIKAMEEELGFALFDRNRQRVALSEMGEALLPELTQVASHYDRALLLAMQRTHEQASQLNVGYLYNAYRTLLPPLTRRFGNEFPDTKLTLRSFGYKGVTDALVHDAVDVAFSLDVDETLHETCEVLKIREDPLCCVVRRDDPLAANSQVSLADLRDESFILPDADYSSAFMHYHEALFLKAGYRPRVAALYSDPNTRNLAVEAGEGIGLIGLHFQPFLDADLKFIPIVEPYCKYDLVALWKKSNPNASIGNLVELLRNALL